MLQPSYTQIMQKLNEEGTSKLTSRYSIVIAASKRARHIIDVINENAAAVKEADKTGERIVDPEKIKEAAKLNDLLKTKKPISIAVDEIYEGNIRMREFNPALEEASDVEMVQEIEEVNLDQGSN